MLDGTITVNGETHVRKQNEVLKASVKMSLLLEADNLLKMGMVYVGINTKQALENCVYNILEVGWKWCAWIKEINPDQVNLTAPII